MYVGYKDQNILINTNFIERKCCTDQETEIEEEEEEFNDDTYFWPIPSIDEFNAQDEKFQIECLIHLGQNIENSYIRNETELLQGIYIESNVPELILEIFQSTPSISVLEHACDVIDKWIKFKLSPDVWFTQELIPFILILATSKLETMSHDTFRLSVNILIQFINIKKEDVLNKFNLQKIMIRTAQSFEKNLFHDTRELLTQLLNSIFSNIREFDINDVLILADIFSYLPECESLTYFPDLMYCALSLCEKSQEFAYDFVKNVNISSIFSQISEVPIQSMLVIIQLINFFLDTQDNFLIDSFINDFQWSWILTILRNPDDDASTHQMENIKENAKESISDLSVKLITTVPDIVEQDGGSDVIEYFCELINNNDFKSRLTAFKATTKLFSIQNPNINDLLIENSYISIASEYLGSAAEGDAIVCIINSIHYIAQYAENFQIPQIIELMAETDIFDLIPDLAESDNKKISESAQELMNDKSLTLLNSYLAEN